ncbi:hypothetical protein ID875_28400, partial [Streptomyces globisporus]|nr:hypothetical protein [Streptomyces globisporus]
RGRSACSGRAERWPWSVWARRRPFDVRALVMRGLRVHGCVEGDADPAVLVPELAGGTGAACCRSTAW